jgi:hypothetical protein
MNVWDVYWFRCDFIPLTFLWVITLVDTMGRMDLIARPTQAPMSEFMTAPPQSAQPQAAQGISAAPPPQLPGDARGVTA